MFVELIIGSIVPSYLDRNEADIANISPLGSHILILLKSGKRSDIPLMDSEGGLSKRICQAEDNSFFVVKVERLLKISNFD